MEAFLRSRVLLSTILEHPLQRALVASLQGRDAQCTADYLDRILREKGGVLATEEGTSLLSLLYALTQSARVFPKCYELKGINPDKCEHIAKGTFSEVFRACYEGQTVCLMANRQFRDNGQHPSTSVAAKEFVMWAHLLHENIIPFYGVSFLGETRQPCLVCPWVWNGDVVQYLRSFPLSPRMPLVSDVVNGLLYLHQLMIVHGNLKGSNILVSGDGRALIAGFALSSVVAGDQGLSDIVGGTLSWMPPERLGDNGAPPTRESDIWSLSCLCYEILAQRTPFDQYKTTLEVISAIVTRREIPLCTEGRNSIDDRMWNLMVRCWDYDPRNRPSCEEVWRFIADLGVRDTRPPVSPQGKSDLTVWDAVRANWDSKIDYHRVYDILAGILRTPDSDLPLATHPTIKSTLPPIILSEKVHRTI